MKFIVLIFASLLMLFHPLHSAIIQDTENKNDANILLNDRNGAISNYTVQEAAKCPDGTQEVEGYCVPMPKGGCKKVCGHGICMEMLGIDICSCNKGYKGELCETATGDDSCPAGTLAVQEMCVPVPSECTNNCNHGKCMEVVSTPVCVCAVGYEGKDCGKETGKAARIGLIVGLCVGIPLVAVAGFFLYRYLRNRR